jgi:hypothetical protein
VQGYIGIDRKACEGKGCCWMPLADPISEWHEGPKLDLPTCFHANTGAPAYEVVEGLGPGGGGVGGIPLRNPAYARRAGGPPGPAARAASLRLVAGVQPELGPDFSTVRLSVEEGGAGGGVPGVVRVRLTDGGGSPRWEVPQKLLAPHSEEEEGGDGATRAAARPPAPRLAFSLKEDPLSLEVTRASADGGDDGTTTTATPSSSSSSPRALLNTTGLRLVLKDQYLELSTWVDPAAAVFGLGERVSSSGLRLPRTGRPLALWNRDCTDFPDVNLYGSFPFALVLHPDGTSHGLLLWNSNAMDAVLRPDRLSFRATGGLLDVYVLGGPTPAAVLDQLTALVGRPALPPLWAFGFHQSKYGYTSIWEMGAVAANYTAARIPLEVMWGDIDYMVRRGGCRVGSSNARAPREREREQNTDRGPSFHLTPSPPPSFFLSLSPPPLPGRLARFHV